MEALKIIETSTPDLLTRQHLFNLWNQEYPEKLTYGTIKEFEDYLEKLISVQHLLLTGAANKIVGWAFSFEREKERWFVIILSEEIQGKGLGKRLLENLKKKETYLNGWVIDHDRDKKLNGQAYRSPVEFYIKCGFEIIKEQRLELEKISAVKIQWNSITGL
jgi:GNAT superfamily N-acetyltransferase